MIVTVLLYASNLFFYFIRNLEQKSSEYDSVQIVKVFGGDGFTKNRQNLTGFDGSLFV